MSWYFNSILISIVENSFELCLNSKFHCTDKFLKAKPLSYWLWCKNVKKHSWELIWFAVHRGEVITFLTCSENMFLIPGDTAKLCECNIIQYFKHSWHYDIVPYLPQEQWSETTNSAKALLTPRSLLNLTCWLAGCPCRLSSVSGTLTLRLPHAGTWRSKSRMCPSDLQPGAEQEPTGEVLGAALSG